MTPYTLRDELYLWWLADPTRPRWVGRLRLVRRTAGHPGGVSLEVEGWQAHFAACGVRAADLERLAEQIDRPYLRGQRQSLL